MQFQIAAAAGSSKSSSSMVEAELEMSTRAYCKAGPHTATLLAIY